MSDTDTYRVDYFGAHTASIKTLSAEVLSHFGPTGLLEAYELNHPYTKSSLFDWHEQVHGICKTVICNTHYSTKQSSLVRHERVLGSNVTHYATAHHNLDIQAVQATLSSRSTLSWKVPYQMSITSTVYQRCFAQVSKRGQYLRHRLERASLSYDHYRQQMTHCRLSADSAKIHARRYHFQSDTKPNASGLAVLEKRAPEQKEATRSLHLLCGPTQNPDLGQGYFYHGFYQLFVNGVLQVSKALSGPVIYLPASVEASDKIDLLVSLKPAKPHDLANGLPLHQFDLTHSVSFPAIVCNLRVDRVSSRLYCKSSILPYAKFLKQFSPSFDAKHYRQYLSALLDYFADQSQIKDPYVREDLWHVEKAYFETSGRSLTLFIHGFNIEYGHFGPIKVAHEKAGELSFAFDGPNWADRWRSDDQLNGTGVFNWINHIEHNLYLAAGKPKDYPRLVNIAWQGNPLSPLDYMTTELVAQLTAIKLAELIRHIRKTHPKLKINILSHSEGAAVAIYTMELIARTAQSIDTLVLWEAAVPNTVLSMNSAVNTPTLSQRWGTTMASQGASCITVLASRYDAILGPFDTYPNESQLMQAKLKQPDGGKQEGILAFVMQCVGDLPLVNKPESIYHLAQLFGLSFDKLLFHSSARSRLLDALDPLKGEFTRAKEDLALFFGVLLSLIFDQLSAYLKQRDVHQAFAKRLHLTPSSNHDTFFDDVLAHLLEDNSFISPKTDLKLARLIDRGLSKLGLITLAKKAAHWLLIDSLYNEGSLPDFRPKTKVQSIEQAIDNQKNKWVFGQMFPSLRCCALAEINLKEAPGHIDLAWIDDAASQMSTLILTILNTKDLDVPPALGVAGPVMDESAQAMIDSGKLTVIHQDNSCQRPAAILASHSGMKYPTPEYLKSIYGDVICKKLGYFS